jgi:polyhydroxyalkanoate synthesis repressor PhaR
MSESKASSGPSGDPVEIRKYPNRRYYNTRESRHITLQEICDLVRQGHDIRVTDSKSGEDITGVVLTQILLDLESPKLAFFPNSLLQHLIRINTGFLDSFAETYFRQAFASFGVGGKGWGGGAASPIHGPALPGSEAWTELFGGFFPGASTAGQSGGAAAGGPGREDPVADLRNEIDSLHKKLERLEKRRKSP